MVGFRCYRQSPFAHDHHTIPNTTAHQSPANPAEYMSISGRAGQWPAAIRGRCVHFEQPGELVALLRLQVDSESVYPAESRAPSAAACVLISGTAVVSNNSPRRGGPSVNSTGDTRPS